MEKQLRKLEAILETLDTSATLDEIAEVLVAASALLQANRDEVENVKQVYDETVSKLRAYNEDRWTKIQEKVEKLRGPKGDDGKTPTKEELTALITPLIPDPIKGEPGAPGIDGSPDTAEQIREKLETLKDDERLDASAIKGLEELVKRLTPTTKSSGTNFVISRGAVKLYDLSSQLDGVTKTFSLPAFWRIISIQSSSFPNAFRPTTDYTSDAAAMTITFTSEIDAAATLATGQTLTVIYAEA